MLEEEGVANGIAIDDDSSPGGQLLRVWCGGSMQPEDLGLLTQWVEWAYEKQQQA